jgi:type VI secretion system protein VasD
MIARSFACAPGRVLALLAPVSLMLLVVWGSGGCAGTAPTCRVPDTVELEIESSDRVNIDEKGESLPTVIRLYQLKDLSALQQASFEDVWERGDEMLADTKVGAPAEHTLFPGQITVQRFKRSGEADFLVAVGVFRKPVGGSWRTINEWPLAGDPCAEKDDEDAAPKLDQLRVRMFLREYRIESTNNYLKLAKRSCPPNAKACRGTTGEAPDELPDALQNRRLRTFEEDQSAPKPTVGSEGSVSGDKP